MKKLFSLVVALFLAINSVPVAQASNVVKVTINGEHVEFDQPPVIIDGRTLTPIRAVCEKLGADVYWDEWDQTILVVKNDIKLVFSINRPEFAKLTVRNFSEYLNGTYDREIIQLDTPPQVINSRTLLPIRAVCEVLGANVEWDEVNRIVVITCNEEIINDVNRDTEFFSMIEYARYFQDYNCDALLIMGEFSRSTVYFEDGIDFLDERIGHLFNELSVNFTGEYSSRIIVPLNYNPDVDLDELTAKLNAEVKILFPGVEITLIKK